MPKPSIQEDQHFWQGIALIGYAILCALSILLVARYGMTDFGRLTFFDLALLGLAAFRAIHLITYDKIFDIVRAAFMDQKGVRLKTADRGWRRLICEFIQCIWCTGMWSGLIVVTVYFLGTWGHYAVVVLAVAGLGSLLQLMSKALAAQL
jgi:hypothetical protein